ncbi:tetraspanin 42Ek [Musca autumnalis]|uniref:tetraspanin 42Ek n=1 Tax=Musca autumnalis TaxID=221902 RepID=UPI003CF38DBD
MGCTSDCMKCILNIFNVIYGISGIVLIVFGVTLLQTANIVQLYIIIAMGAINLIAAILGCCGICHEHVCMTATYALFILSSLIGQIYNKIKPASTDEIKKIIRSTIKAVWDEELKTPGAMDATQKSLKCCGLDGPTDYQRNGRFVLPASCYPDDASTAGHAFYSVGCVTASENKVFSLAKYQTSSEWGVIAVTAILFIFSIYLVFRFNSRNKRYRY